MLLHGTHGQFCLSTSSPTAGTNKDKAFRDEQPPYKANGIAADFVEENAHLADVLQRGGRERQAASEADV